MDSAWCFPLKDACASYMPMQLVQKWLSNEQVRKGILTAAKSCVPIAPPITRIEPSRVLDRSRLPLEQSLMSLKEELPGACVIFLICIHQYLSLGY